MRDRNYVDCKLAAFLITKLVVTYAVDKMPKKSQINEYSDSSEGTGILTLLQTSKGVVPSCPVVFNPPAS
jgi:hypothetical protein